MEFSSLRDEDTDPRNLDRGVTYINNFIFIPAEKRSLVERMRKLLSSKESANRSGW
jgi:hypothetical protein